MNITEKEISRKSLDYKEIGALMKRVFPKDERMPMWLLTIMAKRKKNQFSAFYDRDMFVGLLFTTESKEEVFVLYLAVNDQLHSKGYGSQLIKALIEKHADKRITLFIEDLEPKSSNYNQRVKRLAFYEKNGIFNTGLRAGVRKPSFAILSTDKGITVRQCKSIVKFTPVAIYDRK